MSEIRFLENIGVKIDKEALKKRLVVIIKKDPVAISSITQDIGIGTLTFNSFFTKTNKTRWATLIKIQNWVEKKENELNL